MKVAGATEQQIHEAAEQVNVRIYNMRQSGHGWAFTLKTGEHDRERESWQGKTVSAPPYQRLSQRERTSYSKEHNGERFNPVVPGAVCWHGHRDFFRALFKLAPRAVVRTAMAVYRGAEDFEREYRDTMHKPGMGGGWGSNITPYFPCLHVRGVSQWQPSRSTAAAPRWPSRTWTSAWPPTCNG